MRKAAAKIACVFFLWAAAAFPAEQALIIFFPLDTASTADNLSWLGEGIAFSISRQLSGPGIKVLDREQRFQLVESLDLPPDAHLSHGSMIRAAQEGRADHVVLGSFSGSEHNLKVAIRILDVKELKLSGEIAANGPLSAMPQMENELGWLILSNTGLQKGVSREDFGRRRRKIPNVEYASFIQSFSAAGRNEQMRLLRKAVEGFKEFPEAHFQLGRLYFQKGDWKNALIQLSMSARDTARDPEFEFIRGTCMVQQDQPAQALESLSNVLSFSRSFRVLNNIGVAYLRQRRYGAGPERLSWRLEASPALTPR